jgi:TolB-like protein
LVNGRIRIRAICALLAAAALAALPAKAAAEKLAIAPLDNRAFVTLDEAGVLTNAIVSAFTTGAKEFEVVTLTTGPAEFCDAGCVGARATESGARYLVTGAIVMFGGQYTLTLEATDRSSGSIVASANTPAAATLVGLLAFVQSAAVTLRTSLSPGAAAVPAYAAPAPPPAPAISPPAAPAPSPVATDANGWPIPTAEAGTRPPNAPEATGKAQLIGGVTLTFGGSLITIVGGVLIGSRDNVGGVFDATEVTVLGAVFAGVGVAMMIGGISMWAIHAKRSKPDKAAKLGAFTLLPTPDLVAVGYARTF